MMMQKKSKDCSWNPAVVRAVAAAISWLSDRSGFFWSARKELGSRLGKASCEHSRIQDYCESFRAALKTRPNPFRFKKVFFFFPFLL